MKLSNRSILSASSSTLPSIKPRLTERALYRRTRLSLTGKEQDSETGLHYYGARYLDSRAGRWLSGDPAVSDYVPSAPVNDGAKKRNGSLPGMGGVFNYANLHVYHYAGNNPVKYVDPDGRSPIWNVATWGIESLGKEEQGIERSLFSQQFYTVAERQKGYSNMLNGIANIIGAGKIKKPIIGIVAATVAAIAQAGVNPVDPRLIDYNQAKAFISGAKKEIDKINSILSNAGDNIDIGYEKFLTNQRDLLTTELEMNEIHDKESSAKIKNDLARTRVPYEDKRSTDLGATILYEERYER